MTREQHQRHREMNTIIAALRYWAANVVKDRDWMNMSLEFDYAKLGCSNHTPMQSDEILLLIESLQNPEDLPNVIGVISHAGAFYAFKEPSVASDVALKLSLCGKSCILSDEVPLFENSDVKNVLEALLLQRD